MFKRTVEDFICEHCNTPVKGDGYTNHCPNCLWSKHVDIEPGDRAERCGGLMKPIALEGSSPDYVIVHACERCGVQRRISVTKGDDTQAILHLAQTHSRGILGQ